MPLKTHHNNLAQLKAHIKAFGPTYFHGDGNMYAADDAGKLHSDNNKEFANPNQEEATYRVKFNTVAEVPASVDELNDLLHKSKHSEVVASLAPAKPNAVKTFEVAPDELAEPQAAPVTAADKDKEIEALRAQLAALLQAAEAAPGKGKAKAPKDNALNANHPLQA